MSSSFPFLELPSELRSEVASHLDFPSTLSLSLTSRQCHQAFSPYRGYFDIFGFLEDTIRLGYLELLKYFSSYSSLDFSNLALTFR